MIQREEEEERELYNDPCDELEVYPSDDEDDTANPEDEGAEDEVYRRLLEDAEESVARLEFTTQRGGRA